MRLPVLFLTIGFSSVAMVATGCNGDDPAGRDRDGDGVTASVDCDDTNPNIGAGGPEICGDGLDNDCDGEIDENLISAYPDEDADGYGDATAEPELVCVVGGGFTENADDCNDDDSSINPTAIEDCTPIDRNCDGSPDAGAQVVTWYLDVDGDGYGDSDLPQEACDQPPYHVRDGGDCAPEDPNIYPRFWYDDVDGDGYGDNNDQKPEFLCEPPANAATRQGDCNDIDPNTYEGANELCDGGIDNDCDPTTDENDTAQWFPDLDGDGYGDDQSADIYLGCDPPLGLIQVGGDCDDNDGNLNPRDTPGCIQVHAGDIIEDEVWKNTVKHLVVDTVVVEGSLAPRLTIQEGAIVEIDPGYGIDVAIRNPGSILVEGTEKNPVTFTTAAPLILDESDHWNGIAIGDEDAGSELYYFSVEYAGAGTNRNGALELDKSDLSEPVIIEGATIHNSLVSGMYVSDGEPEVTYSTFRTNARNGVQVDEGAGLADFQYNTLGDNDDYVIVIPGSHAHEIVPNNDFTKITDPSRQRIELLQGTLRVTGTWYDHGLYYLVRENDTVDVEDGPQSVLTMEDGVTVEFGFSAGLRIGNREEGTLIFEEGPLGIVYTLAADAKVGQNWDGVEFGPEDGGSLVRNLEITYGGLNSFGQLYVRDSSPTITDVVSRYSDSDGLHVTGRLAAPLIQNSEFTDNDEEGVYVNSNSGIARSKVGPTFSGNIVTDNGTNPVVFPPNFVGELDPSSTFADGFVGIHGGEVLEDAIWLKLDEAYQVFGDIDIGGPQDPVVEIEEAVVMYFDRDTGIDVGTFYDGALRIDAANNGKANWVTMTSSDPVPGPGDWEGIAIGANGPQPANRQTDIRGLTIQYAGGNGLLKGGAIELLWDCDDDMPLVELVNVDILDSSRAAVYTQSTAHFAMDSVLMDSPLDGCFLRNSPVCPHNTAYFINNECVDAPAFGEWSLSEVTEFEGTNNTFSGPVYIDDVFLSVSTTMPDIGQPYVFRSRVNVRDATDPTLTIRSGADLQFDNAAGLDVGAALPGSLSIESGATLSDNGVGSWWGIKVGQQCGNITIDGATIENAGGNGEGALWVNLCPNGSVSNTSFLTPLGCAIAESNPDTSLTFTNNTVTGAELFCET